MPAFGLSHQLPNHFASSDPCSLTISLSLPLVLPPFRKRMVLSLLNPPYGNFNNLLRKINVLLHGFVMPSRRLTQQWTELEWERNQIHGRGETVGPRICSKSALDWVGEDSTQEVALPMYSLCHFKERGALLPI